MWACRIRYRLLADPIYTDALAAIPDVHHVNPRVLGSHTLQDYGFSKHPVPYIGMKASAFDQIYVGAQ